MKKVNFRIVISATVLSILLMGCGGSAGVIVDKLLEKSDDAIKSAEKNRSSTFKFINATTEMTNFYVRPFGIIENIYSSEYEVASILEGEVTESYTYRWNKDFSKTQFALADSGSLSKKKKLQYTIENDSDYWGIAWLDNNKYSMSFVDFVSNPTSDSYAIRFFSMADKNIFVGESNSPLVAAIKGKVTATFTFDNCAELEVINDNPSNFCQVANVGESYIAVIGVNGEVTIGQE